MKHIEGRGNIHILSLSKYEYDNSNWIYVNSLEGRISAKDIVFSRYWACIEYPWSTSNLKGHIEFTKDKLNKESTYEFKKDLNLLEGR